MFRSLTLIDTGSNP